jgi:uncharacterized membrane protein
VLWAITGIFQKISAQHGTPPTIYLAVFGLVIFVSGLASSIILAPERGNLPGLAFAGLAGVSFALGTAAISFALWRYGAAISKLTPVLNTNILITVIFGLLFLKEAGGVNPWQLSAGALLVTIGAAIVATA